MIVAILLLGICVLLGVLGIFDYKVSEKPKNITKVTEPKPLKKAIVEQRIKQSKNTSK
jgi:hypothetical protein